MSRTDKRNKLQSKSVCKDQVTARTICKQNQWVQVRLTIRSAVKIGLTLKQFHVSNKGGHCLGTTQACTRGIGVQISIVLEVIGHFLFKMGCLWNSPVRSWLSTIACSLTQGTRIYRYMGYGLGSQRFSRYWSTSGLRGTGPYRMVMVSIPSNVHWHKEQEYVWFMGGNLSGFQYVSQRVLPVLRRRDHSVWSRP
jgi:hypothetical protein